MSSLIPLLEAFLLDKAVRGTLVVSNKSKIGFLLFGIAAICLIGSLILLIIGVYHWIGMRYATDMAALTAAAMVFILAVIFALIGYEIMRKRSSRLKAMQKDLTDSAMDWFETVADELHLPEAVRKHPKTTLAVSTLVGFLIARKVL